jgi:predicted alpha/beta hydrolase family esterase
MVNNINIILEKIKVLPTIKSGKNSIIALSSNDASLSAEDFSEAIEYIWENDLVKILKVEREYKYIIKIYADVTELL